MKEMAKNIKIFLIEVVPFIVGVFFMSKIFINQYKTFGRKSHPEMGLGSGCCCVSRR